jgi:short-subunit dehydrogenase
MITNKNKHMKEYVLLTGASSGIGYEMAKLLAAKRQNLILVARSTAKLESIKTELHNQYGVVVHIISKDLSVVEEAFELHKETEAMGLKVTMLVNNAGAGVYGDFSATSLEEELAMIALNCATTVALTKLYLRDMLKNKSGRIMNIASLLSFLPFPYYSVYSATKTFVLAFTETVAAELEGTGVVVTALCPGPVDTGFNTDKMLATNAYKANKPVQPNVVAEQGIQLLLKGKGKKIVGFNNWFISNLPRVTPDSIMMKIKKKLASQTASGLS